MDYHLVSRVMTKIYVKGHIRHNITTQDVYFLSYQTLLVLITNKDE